MNQAEFKDPTLKQMLPNNNMEQTESITTDFQQAAALSDDHTNNPSVLSSPPHRLFVDMDGTLAVFDPTKTLEELYEPGYFRNLSPMTPMVEAVRSILREHPEIEVNILSAALDSPYAVAEKNAWLDEYLPEVPVENRIFTKCGEDKKAAVPGGVVETDVLLDDYTKNLLEWDPPGRGIKALNGINHTHETWEKDRISVLDQENLSSKLARAITGAEPVLDPVPGRPSLKDYRKTLVVNLYGGPGAGKTTCAWQIASELKKLGYHAEYVSEYAKDLVYEQRLQQLDGTPKNQSVLLSEQRRRIDRVIGKVDIIVTDSPLMLNTVYQKQPDPSYTQSVKEQVDQYNNFNLVVERGKSFQQSGRIHDLKQSIKLDEQIRQMLSENNMYYGVYQHDSVDICVKNIISSYSKLKDPVLSTPTPQKRDKDHYLRTRRGQSDRPLYEASREQLEQLKRDVSILTVAEDLGYHPVRSGGAHWSLEEHDSVQFYLDTNTYTQFSKGEGGSVIDFTMHLGDMEKRDAIRWLKERYLSLEASIFPRHPWVPQAEAKPVEKKPFVLPEKVQGRFSRAVAYLVKTRCIDPEVVRDGIRSGLIYEDNHHNVVFVGKDPDGKPGFATRRGTNTEKPFRGDIVGSDQTLGFKVEGKNATRLYVTEAPIDALSVLTIDRRRGYNTTNATYLATCGTGKTKVVERYLREHPETREVVLANDNDPAGQEANRKLTEFIRSQNQDIIIQEIKPQGNDVNEMLQNSIKAERKTQKKQADPPVDPEQ